MAKSIQQSLEWCENCNKKTIHFRETAYSMIGGFFKVKFYLVHWALNQPKYSNKIQ